MGRRHLLEVDDRVVEGEVLDGNVGARELELE
jgi:hypothetical protein